MSKILRKSALVFGSQAATDQIAQFGSLANSTPTFSTDPAVIQSLSQWIDGWFNAVIGDNSPAIEDMNAFCYVMAYQVAYLMQAGIPEWDAGTTYYTNSMVNYGGVIYVSLIDSNLNQTPTVGADWYIISGGGPRRINNQTGSSYTLALADGSASGGDPLITMTSSSVQTITIPTNASVAFPIGTEIDLLQLGTGKVVVEPAGGVTMNSYLGFTSLLGQFTNASLIKTGTDTWEFFGQIAIGFITATGGTITTNGNFKVHTFTSSGNFIITSGAGQVGSLIVAGGGAGSGLTNGITGGGGGGGVLEILVGAGPTLTSGTFPVVVGPGGISTSTGSIGDGSNSSFNGGTALGGGGSGLQGINADSGGSGGGGGGGNGTQSLGGAGTVGQGFAGGDGNPAATLLTGGGGGGGGAGTVGAAGSPTGAGAGGNGYTSSITGSPIAYAGGGGGGSDFGGAAGGTGGGGAGSIANGTPGTAGTDGLGGGGGGYYGNGIQSVSGNGGSGVVIITYQFQ